MFNEGMMIMKRYVNFIGLIKPEYLETLRETTEQPGKYNYCINDFDDTVELAYEYGKNTIIVPKDKFKPAYYPDFHLGNKVKRIDGTRTGIIYKVYWVYYFGKVIIWIMVIENLQDELRQKN